MGRPRLRQPECMSKIETQLLANLQEFVGFARNRLADPELAADAVQESLLKAIKAVDRVKDDESAKAWFYRILRRTIIDLYRRRDVQERAIARLERELSAPPTEDEERVACGCLQSLIPTLKPQYSTLVRRLDLDNEPVESVAASLGVTKNNLTVRLHRARKKLKERLTETCRMCAKHGCLNCTCDSANGKEG
jgi:RNA polymerase sigma factor (sigma-70 family)